MMLRVKATWGRITGWEGRFTPAPCSRKIEEKSGGKPPFPTCDPAQPVILRNRSFLNSITLTHHSSSFTPYESRITHHSSLPNHPIVNLLDLVDDLLPAEAGI